MTAETAKDSSHEFYEEKIQEIEASIRAELEIPEEIPLNIVGYQFDLKIINDTPKSPGISVLATKNDFEASDQEYSSLRIYLSKVAAEYSLNLGVDGILTRQKGDLVDRPDVIFFILTQEKLRIFRELPRRLDPQEVISLLEEKEKHLSEQMANYHLDEPYKKGFGILFHRKERLERTIQKLKDSIMPERGHGPMSKDAIDSKSGPEPDRF